MTNMSVFDSQQGQEIFLFPNKHTGSQATQPPMQWVPWAVSLGVKKQGHKTDHSPPYSAEVKNGGAILPLPHTSSWHGACLIKTGITLLLPLFF
jgi:hypothetical protein